MHCNVTPDSTFIMIRQTLILALFIVALINETEANLEKKLLKQIPEIGDDLTAAQCENLGAKLDRLEANWKGKLTDLLEGQMENRENGIDKHEDLIKECEDAIEALDETC